jgi:N-acetylgalactosamine-6-sulfatase
LDGHAVLQDVIEGRDSATRDFFWRARRGDRTWRAVRSGNLKWIAKEDAGGTAEEWLFDLATDPTETKDVKQAHPDEAGRLRALVKAWETSVKPER